MGTLALCVDYALFCFIVSGRDVELQLVNAGIHVFCEKPVTTLSPEDYAEYSKTVAEGAEKKNVIFSVGYMFRFVSKLKCLTH